MKSPEEIKLGLAACSADECHGEHTGCPYKGSFYCVQHICGDTMLYILQLERERDAAVRDMTELMQLSKSCCYCKHLTNDGECTKDFNGIDTEMLGKPGGWWCWEWRGAQ